MVPAHPQHKCRIKKRAAFLHAAKGVYLARDSFVLQCNTQSTEPTNELAEKPVKTQEPRVGFTVTKKMGKAVIRNRIRRRLKEAMRLSDVSLMQPGHDYVLVGRTKALSIGFTDLCNEVKSALRKVAKGEGRPARPLPTRKKSKKNTSHRQAFASAQGSPSTQA